MAQSYVTDAGTLIIPGAYTSYKVQNGSGGLATSGVIFLVGEADAGPDYSAEADLALNIFGPGSAADVISKYKSGPLVDAYKIACAPANDPDIQGSPSAFVLVKTNPSVKASSALSKIGGGTYGTLYDKSYGALGNLIYYSVAAKTAEAIPTTGAFTYIPPASTTGGANISFRKNGGTERTYTVAAGQTPTAFVSGVNALTDIAASGGAARTTIQNSVGTLAVAIAANVVTITYAASTFTTTPSVGDTVMIPTGSVIAGAGNANVGAYLVTAATSTVITATKLSDAGKAAAAPGTITPPVVVGAIAVSATAANDLVDYGPVTIVIEDAGIIDGLGKTLEINELTSSTDLFSRCAFVLGTTTAVSWVSKTGAATAAVSASEYSVTLSNNRQVDNVQEQLTAGGKIGLQLGYIGTSCGVVVGPTTIVLTPVGGLSAGQTITLAFKDYPTIADLANYIAAKPGFVAKAGTASLGQMSPLALDEGTWTCGSNFGSYSLRIKLDAVAFYNVIAGQSALVQLGNPAIPVSSGLPDVTTGNVYLTNGARGATTDAVFNAAIDALETVKGNFLVPLFSRDASADKADSLTDSASSYTIANIQAYAKTHCLKMSQLKRRKNRQTILSQRDTFANVQVAAANLASARCTLAFQDVKAVGATGLTQFQPWMTSVLAAAMQSAGFYRALVHKGINCSGVVQAAADFKDSNDDNMETALQAGLLVAKKSDDGGYIWVSDQTTYSKDSNFVYNSIQAVYVADIIGLTMAQRMEKAFVGQSVADITAPVALAALEAIMADFLRLKLIAASDDAPKGYKNASIKIQGGVMLVSIEVKLAGAIYFINIPFLVSMVQSSASS